MNGLCKFVHILNRVLVLDSALNCMHINYIPTRTTLIHEYQMHYINTTVQCLLHTEALYILRNIYLSKLGSISTSHFNLFDKLCFFFQMPIKLCTLSTFSNESQNEKLQNHKKKWIYEYFQVQ